VAGEVLLTVLGYAFRNGRSSVDAGSNRGPAGPSNRHDRQDADATIACLTICRRRGPNLVPDFFNLRQAHLVQQ
jgi:hypothetical protein